MAPPKLSNQLCRPNPCNPDDLLPKPPLHFLEPFTPPLPPAPKNTAVKFRRREGEVAKRGIKEGASLLALALCVGLLIIVSLAIIKYYLARKHSRGGRRSSPLETQEDLFDEEQGPPELDHPIWYINTVGLQQSIIDSITVFKYKKSEGLIEGTECSVCLSEFQEDENLRLLPKCSHAFHIPCIDTWLRSHTNCPLCRAPVVSNSSGSWVSSSVGSNLSASSGLREDNEVENDENYVGLVSDEAGEGGTSRSAAGDVNLGALPNESRLSGRSSKRSLSCQVLRNCELRALSNLVDNRQALQDEIQPMRRSVSLDFRSASSIYYMASHISGNERGEMSDMGMAQAKNVNGSSRARRLTYSSSIGCLLQRPLSLKRSYPIGGRILSSIRCRSQDLNLPL